MSQGGFLQTQLYQTQVYLSRKQNDLDTTTFKKIILYFNYDF